MTRLPASGRLLGIVNDMADDPDQIKALLLVSPGCVHCAASKRILEKLLQEELVGKVDIVDIVEDPSIAQQYSVKSVPWLMLGSVYLYGAHSEAELREWIEILKQDDASKLVARLLKSNNLNQVINMVEQHPAKLVDVLKIITEAEQDLKIRLGISAVMEHFEGKPALRQLIPQLGELSKNKSTSVRADAAHFLSLTHANDVISILQNLAQDTDPEVREIANKGLQQLSC